MTLCIERRAEGTAAMVRGLHEMPIVYFDLARAKDEGKRDDALTAYQAFLAIEHDADVDDPAAAFARKRVLALANVSSREASPTPSNGESIAPR